MGDLGVGSRIAAAFHRGRQRRQQREEFEQRKQDRELNRMVLKLKMDNLKLQQRVEERQGARSEAIENLNLQSGQPAGIIGICRDAFRAPHHPPDLIVSKWILGPGGLGQP